MLFFRQKSYLPAALAAALLASCVQYDAVVLEENKARDAGKEETDGDLKKVRISPLSVLRISPHISIGLKLQPSFTPSQQVLMSSPGFSETRIVSINYCLCSMSN